MIAHIRGWPGPESILLRLTVRPDYPLRVHHSYSHPDINVCGISHRLLDVLEGGRRLISRTRPTAILQEDGNINMQCKGQGFS